MLQSPWAQAACAGVCLVVAFAAGLSLNGKEDGAEEGGAVGMTVPPSDRNGKSASAPNEHVHTGARAPHSGASDTITNNKFNPVWHNRW